MFATPYPSVAFAFKVQIAGDRSAQGGSFAEVSGLDTDMDVLTLAEGGENRFSHQLPGRIKHQNLILKRGIFVANSPLMIWCQDTLEGNLSKRIETKDIIVSLLNEFGNPTMTWALARAYPVKWSVAQLSAKNNDVAMETVEFAFQRIKRDMNISLKDAARRALG